MILFNIKQSTFLKLFNSLDSLFWSLKCKIFEKHHPFNVKREQESISAKCIQLKRQAFRNHMSKYNFIIRIPNNDFKIPPRLKKLKSHRAIQIDTNKVWFPRRKAQGGLSHKVTEEIDYNFSVAPKSAWDFPRSFPKSFVSAPGKPRSDNSPQRWRYGERKNRTYRPINGTQFRADANYFAQQEDKWIQPVRLLRGVLAHFRRCKIIYSAV